VKHCYRKLGVRSAAHALTRALELRLVLLRDLFHALGAPGCQRRSASARLRQG